MQTVRDVLNAVERTGDRRTLPDGGRRTLTQQLQASCGRLLSACQAVLDRHSLPALVAGRDSFWQILFLDVEPRNQLDIELIRQGVFALPGVRRFTSTILTENDIAETAERLDSAWRAM